MNLKSASIACAIACLSGMAYAQNTFDVDGINYKKTGESTVSVERKSGETYTGNVVIPATIEYDGKNYSVTEISTGAFYNSTELQSVTFGKNIEKTGLSVFSGCFSLESVLVDTDNGYYTSVDGVLYTKDMKILERYPQAKTGTQYSIPEGTEGIQIQAFDYTTDLDKVILPESMKAIGAYAFMASSISEISIPDAVTYVGDYAFYQCPILNKVVIGKGLTEISSFTFNSCSELKTVEINSDLTSIGAYAFFSCMALEEFTFPESLETIDDGAFKSCENLHAALLGKNVKNIGLIPFSFCKALRAIKVSEENPYLCDINGVLCNKSGTKLIEYPCGRPGEYEIPESVTEICGNAFYYCTRLTEITIPEGVTEIGVSAFHACQGLTSVTIPNSVTTLGSQAFMFCEDLREATLGSGLTSIGTLAFSMCDNLRTLNSKATTPPALASINAFSTDCYEACKLNVPESAVSAYSSALGWNMFKNVTGVAGVESITVAPVQIQIANGVISFSETSDVEIYNLSGEILFHGTCDAWEIPSTGIYIVKANNQIFKVNF